MADESQQRGINKMETEKAFEISETDNVECELG